MHPERQIDNEQNDDDVGRDNLESSLRLSIKEAEDTVLSSSPRCSQVLAAIHAFLTQWDVLEGRRNVNGVKEPKKFSVGVSKARELPRDFLRGVFCRMLSKLDPVQNADVVRERILTTLRSLETDTCRQVLFEFLPAIARTFDGNSSHTNVSSDVKSKKVKKQILSCLKEVFENDPNSLPQILQFFSSMLTKSLPNRNAMYPRDVFYFIIDLLPATPETDLHVAIRALIYYVDSSEDARLAIDSIRTELALLEKTDISDMMHVAICIEEAVRGTGKNQQLFVEEYFVVVEELFKERTKNQNLPHHDDIDQSQQVQTKILTFDLIMITASVDSTMHHDKIMPMITDGSLFESGLLSVEHISRLVELAKDGSISETIDNSNEVDSCSQQHLLRSLVAFSVKILLTPLRYTFEFESEQFFSKSQAIVIHVITKLPKHFQTNAISALLKIVDELMVESKNLDSASMGKDRLQDFGEISITTCRNIFELLLSLARRLKDILVPFQDRLVNYVTSESFDHLQTFDLFQIISTVVATVLCSDNINGQLQSINISRTLLFSSAQVSTVSTQAQMQDEKITYRQIRGMIFADEVLLSCDLDTTSLEIMQKMVSRALLSPHSNINSLDPRIGLQGMKILGHLRKQTNCNNSLERDLFQVASLALSHSRIVQYPEGSSKQFTKQRNPILAYTEIPSFPTCNDQTVKRRFRKMIFCFNSFFNNVHLSQPSSWYKSSLWIFELIDTYLVLGRTPKWNPRAWIVS